MPADLLDTVPALLAFAVAMLWTPGPNNLMLASSGATFGLKRTLPHLFGVALGFPVMLFTVALGLGEVFRTQPALREAISWAGVLVMLYLAYRIATQTPHGDRGTAQPLSFMSAAAFQWVNPKAWMLTIAAAATFASGADPTLEAAFVALVFALVGLTSATGWTAAGAAMQRVLGSGLRLRAFNIVMAVLLALSALWLVLER